MFLKAIICGFPITRNHHQILLANCPSLNTHIFLYENKNINTYCQIFFRRKIFQGFATKEIKNLNFLLLQTAFFVRPCQLSERYFCWLLLWFRKHLQRILDTFKAGVYISIKSLSVASFTKSFQFVKDSLHMVLLILHFWCQSNYLLSVKTDQVAKIQQSLIVSICSTNLISLEQKQ